MSFLDLFYELELVHRRNLIDNKLIHVFSCKSYDNQGDPKWDERVLTDQQLTYRKRKAKMFNSSDQFSKAKLYPCAVTFCDVIVGSSDFYNTITYGEMMRIDHLLQLNGYKLWTPSIPDIDIDMEEIIIDK